MTGRQEADYAVKVVFVGLCGEGKTSLLKAMTQGDVDLKELPTIGIEFGAKIVTLPDKKTVKLQMWTTSGQEKYQAMDEPFYHGAQIACIVVDQALPVSKRKNLVRLYSEAIALYAADSDNPPTIFVLEHDKTNTLRLKSTYVIYEDYRGDRLKHLVVSAMKVAEDFQEKMISPLEAAILSLAQERIYLAEKSDQEDSDQEASDQDSDEEIDQEQQNYPSPRAMPFMSKVSPRQSMGFWRSIAANVESSALARAINWLDSGPATNAKPFKLN